MNALQFVLNKEVAQVERAPGGGRYDFRFASEADADLATSASRLLIGEDVVSTLGSVAGVRRLVNPEAHVHSIGHILRGVVNPPYQEGLSDHYLVRRHIPLRITAQEFREQFGIEPVRLPART
jgi:hypothetical protein